ncbi:MAG: hypothetical protein GY898_06740 [Proteobacteria bacterium]|nr:hypothetical protein [Pseudomonadota bacterium]
MPVVSPSCYELLGVPMDSPRPTLSRAWSERRAEVGRSGSLDEADVDALTARIDEAFRILSDGGTASRYRIYQSQLKAGVGIGRPQDFGQLPPDQINTDPGRRSPLADFAGPPTLDDDADTDEVTDEWKVDLLDDEDVNEVSRTDAFAPSFPAALGVLADLVLAVPAGEPPAAVPRRHTRAPLPPWHLMPPEADAMELPKVTAPGEPTPSAARATTQPGNRVRAERPPWER